MLVVYEETNELNAIWLNNSAETLFIPFFVDNALDEISIYRQDFNEPIRFSILSYLPTDHKFVLAILFRPFKPLSKVWNRVINCNLTSKNQAAEINWKIFSLLDVFVITSVLIRFKDSHAKV